MVVGVVYNDQTPVLQADGVVCSDPEGTELLLSSGSAARHRGLRHAPGVCCSPVLLLCSRLREGVLAFENNLGVVGALDDNVDAQGAQPAL